MRHDKAKVILPKMLSTLALVLGFVPVFGLIGGLSVPQQALHCVYFPLAALVLACVNHLIPGNSRPGYMVASLLLYALVVWTFIPEEAPIYTYLALVPGATVLILVPPSCSRPVGTEWNLVVWGLSVVAGLAAQVTFYGNINLTNSPQALTLRTMMAIAFVLHLLLAVMTLNRQSMDSSDSNASASNGRAGLSALMNRRNRGAVLILFLLALIISCFHIIGRFFEWLWSQIVRFVLFLLSLMPDNGMVGGAGSQQDMSEMFAGIGNEEPSAFAVFMEKVFIVLAAVAITALMVLALYFLGKKIWQAWKRLMAKWRAYASRSAEEYEDETESIFDAEEMGRALSERFKQLFKSAPKYKRPDWNKLDGRGKIRYLYRCFWERHPKQQHLTAREALMAEDTISKTVTGKLADLYDKARYSDHAVSEQDAEELKTKLNY